MLKNYILHRALPTQFTFKEPPQLIDRSAIFLPSGYDSLQLVDKSLLGPQPRWEKDTPFNKMVPAPSEQQDDTSTSALLAGDIRVDSHQAWLEKLEKAAGAGLEELQKQSIEASKRTEAAAATRRAAAERRKREEKDVSSKHLQNFFNNLLSRPEKSKSSRSITSDAKKVGCSHSCYVMYTGTKSTHSYNSLHSKGARRCQDTCRAGAATAYQAVVTVLLPPLAMIDGSIALFASQCFVYCPPPSSPIGSLI